MYIKIVIVYFYNFLVFQLFKLNINFILFIFIYHLSQARSFMIILNIVNPNSQLLQSSNMFSHPNFLKHHCLLYEQEIWYLLLLTKRTVVCIQNSIQNDLNITHNDEIQSCETQIKYNYIIPTPSTPNNHAQHIGDTSVRLVK